MKTLSELIEFVNHCEAAGVKIPDNVFVCSPEIIKEATPWEAVGDAAILRDAMSIKIYGIRVVREFAEVMTSGN